MGKRDYRFKDFAGGTNPENRDIQCMPIHFLNW